MAIQTMNLTKLRTMRMSLQTSATILVLPLRISRQRKNRAETPSTSPHSHKRRPESSGILFNLLFYIITRPSIIISLFQITFFSGVLPLLHKKLSPLELRLMRANQLQMIRIWMQISQFNIPSLGKMRQMKIMTKKKWRQKGNLANLKRFFI